MEMKDKIRSARESKGLSQDDVAKAVGISQPAMKKIESGETKKSKYLPEILEFLEIGNVRPAPIPAAPIMGERDLPIFAAAEGGPGEMVVSTDAIEWVVRPWYLRSVKDGYGVVVIGESMHPKYEPGDILIVNPRLPALRNKPAIFVSDENGGEFTATVKILIREQASDWRVAQYNPAKEFLLPKKTWRKALRIVGTYEGS